MGLPKLSEWLEDCALEVVDWLPSKVTVVSDFMLHILIQEIVYKDPPNYPVL